MNAPHCSFILLFLQSLVFQVGCTSVSIQARLPGLALGAGPIVSEQAAPVGFQYLLGGLPFSRIVIFDASSDIQRALWIKGQQVQGQQVPTARMRGAGDARMLQVTITSLSLNAYDFFLTRKLSCAVTAEIRRSPSHTAAPKYFAAAHSEYSAYGFRNDLERAWTRCVLQGARVFYGLEAMQAKYTIH